MFSGVAKHPRTFQLLMLAPRVRRRGVQVKLGADTARTADPNWPKGHSIPYDDMLSI